MPNPHVVISGVVQDEVALEISGSWCYLPSVLRKELTHG